MKSQEEFVMECRRIRDGLIRSALEETGQQLKAQGHDYKLTDDPMPPLHPLHIPPYGALTLLVFSKNVNWNELEGFPFPKVPYISFGLSLAERKAEVFVHPASEDQIGQRTSRTTGRYTLEELTSETIEREVNNFLTEILLQ